ncbi:MAG: hypothetical protein IJ297_05450, partial [Clostridia bacterium]|nr:hypothetical protein [Clostridia bacterium]
MKKIIALIMALMLMLSFSACGKKEVTTADANEFLTEFFASYTKMNEYLKSPDIAISAFALDGEGLSSILKAVYQAQSVTFTFPEPQKVSENIFTATVEVTAPNIEPLYDMYAIDREFLGGEIPEGFVAQSFYDNICSGTTRTVTTNVTVSITCFDGKWSVASSNDLAMAM